MSRALFLPSYHGGGFGHISRCLALGQILSEADWDVAFYLGGTHAPRLQAEGWRLFQPPAPRSPLRPGRLWRGLRQRLSPSPAYLFFSDLSFQVVRDGFHTPDVVRQRLDWTQQVVDHYRPDVLIGDLHLLTGALGKLNDLPVVQITRAATYPQDPALVWWRPIPNMIRTPDVAPVFNPALETLGLPYIQETGDLLAGDLFLIPSIPEVDPLPPDSRKAQYVGPLTRKSEVENIPSWMQALSDRQRPLVYVTVGGGSDSSQQKDLLALWFKAFEGMPWDIVISTGGRRAPRQYERRDNPRVFSWIPAGRRMVEMADVVVFHGGYGTMMETIQSGTPSVVFPFHTEQESNGRRLKALGLAEVVAPSEAVFTLQRTAWRDQTLTTLVVPRLVRTSGEVREAVQHVLSEASYTERATQIRNIQVEYDTPQRVLEALASLG